MPPLNLIIVASDMGYSITGATSHRTSAIKDLGGAFRLCIPREKFASETAVHACLLTVASYKKLSPATITSTPTHWIVSNIMGYNFTALRTSTGGVFEWFIPLHATDNVESLKAHILQYGMNESSKWSKLQDYTKTRKKETRYADMMFKKRQAFKAIAQTLVETTPPSVGFTKTKLDKYSYLEPDDVYLLSGDPVPNIELLMGHVYASHTNGNMVVGYNYS
jgi:hypothetical protein